MDAGLQEGDVFTNGSRSVSGMGGSEASCAQVAYQAPISACATNASQCANLH